MQFMGISSQIVKFVLVKTIKDIFVIILPQDTLGVVKALPVTFGKSFAGPIRFLVLQQRQQRTAVT